MEKGMVREGEC